MKISAQGFLPSRGDPDSKYSHNKMGSNKSNVKNKAREGIGSPSWETKELAIFIEGSEKAFLDR